MLEARVTLTRPAGVQRQFAATTGSGHHLILDDPAGGTGPKPIELFAVGMAGCTAFDVITYLRHKRHERVTGYEVRVTAEQAPHPPQVFTAVRVHHVITGINIEPQAVEDAIRLSEEKYCAAEAMLKHTARFTTTFEVVPERHFELVGAPNQPTGSHFGDYGEGRRAS